MTKFEMWMMIGVLIGWAQMMYGYTDQAFYALGMMIVVCLLAIVGYLRVIYVEK